MSREGCFRAVGLVVRVEKHGVVRVRLKNGHEFVGFLDSRLDFTEHGVGESVSVEMTPFDMSQGKVVGKSNDL